MVSPEDFQAAGDIVKFSVGLYSLMKNDVQNETRDETIPFEDITEDIILKNLLKLRTIWTRALKQESEVKLSEMRKDKMFPASCSKNVFLQVNIALAALQMQYKENIALQALEKFGIAEVVSKMGGNNKPVKSLKFITETDNPDVVRLMELISDAMKEKNIMFDPLKLFTQ